MTMTVVVMTRRHHYLTEAELVTSKESSSSAWFSMVEWFSLRNPRTGLLRPTLPLPHAYLLFPCSPWLCHAEVSDVVGRLADEREQCQERDNSSGRSHPRSVTQGFSCLVSFLLKTTELLQTYPAPPGVPSSLASLTSFGLQI